MGYSYISAGVVVRDKTGRLLTIKNNDAGAHKGKIGFPKGEVDEGESPENCAFRELFEEVRVKITKVFAVSVSNHNSHWYFAETDHLDFSIDEKEIEWCKWATVEEVSSYMQGYNMNQVSLVVAKFAIDFANDLKCERFPVQENIRILPKSAIECMILESDLEKTSSPTTPAISYILQTNFISTICKTLDGKYLVSKKNQEFYKFPITLACFFDDRKISGRIFNHFRENYNVFMASNIAYLTTDSFVKYFITRVTHSFDVSGYEWKTRDEICSASCAYLWPQIEKVFTETSDSNQSKPRPKYVYVPAPHVYPPRASPTPHVCPPRASPTPHVCPPRASPPTRVSMPREVAMESKSSCDKDDNASWRETKNPQGISSWNSTHWNTRGRSFHRYNAAVNRWQ